MSTDRPNIVLVSIDSLRADHCGHLGDDRGLTPTLDDFAASGVAFETAIAPGPRTFSSMPAIFTGRHQASTRPGEYPGETGWEQRLAAIDAHLGRHRSLAERLQDQGYDTAGFSPNPWTSAASGFDRGFDRFVDCSGAEDDTWVDRLVDVLPAVDGNRRLVELVGNMATGSSFFARWENYYDQIRRATDELSEPYFLWVFLLDTHYPFITSRDHRQEQTLVGMYYSAYRAEAAMRGHADSMDPAVLASLERSYRDSIRATDAFLDRLRTDLAPDDPVYVVHADHGESFGERGHYGHHRGDVYEENIHVPYVIHGADVDASVTAPTSLASIHDATLSLAAGEGLDPTDATDAYAFASDVRGNNRALRGERFKLVRSRDGDRLFDLQADAGERADVTGDHPAVYRDLAAVLESYETHIEEKEALSRAVTAVTQGGVP